MNDVNSYMNPVAKILGIDECEINRVMFSRVWLELDVYITTALGCCDCITQLEFAKAIALAYEDAIYVENVENQYWRARNYLKKVVPKASFTSRRIKAY